MRIQCGSPSCMAFVDVIPDEDRGKMPSHRKGFGSMHEVGDWCHMSHTNLYDPDHVTIEICPACNTPDIIVSKSERTILEHFFGPDNERCDLSDHTFGNNCVEIVEEKAKELSGPNDWGYKYDPPHQRDPFDPSKPLAR